MTLPESPHRILDPGHADDARVLDSLRADDSVAFVDTWDTQAEALSRLVPAPEPDVLAEGPRWVHYPWRRAVVKTLGPRAFRRLRLDRNRNLITTEEQDRLAGLRVGVVGLSSGHVIAHTLALQGVCGLLRLADFDEMELSNLNRVPASLFDLGVNKAVVAARRIAELDPYLTVEAAQDGFTTTGADQFLTGLDVVIEECDSLDVKVLLREQARARGIPVLMATSDRGLVDVERFDAEPDRPIFHGLLGDLDTATLTGLTSPQKVPHVLRLVDAPGLTSRAAASIIEVGHGLSTWPQLAGDVTVGASAMAEAVRRIGLGEPLASGRVHLNVGAILDRLAEPELPEVAVGPGPQRVDPPSGVIDAMVLAARRAPSGGNVQPWHLEAGDRTVTVSLAPEWTSTMDVSHRASAVAVGAAVFNARAAAAAMGYGTRVCHGGPSATAPLTASVELTEGEDAERAPYYPALLTRATNRHYGTPAELPAEVGDALRRAALRERAEVHIVTGQDQLAVAADILAAADRIRYLTPRLHAEMVSELRWPGHDDLDTGIDVRTLELGPGALLTLDILKRPEVMAALADWDAGDALGADTQARVGASTALAVITVEGTALVDYARGGSAAEAVWITAEGLGLAVQPISPPFLYANDDDELRDVSRTHWRALSDLRTRFHALSGGNGTPVLALRLAYAPTPSVTSRRRGVTIDVPGG